MNYQLIIDRIITKALSENRKKGQGIYYEEHHILPKCMGGEKGPTVFLIGKEHFLTHFLLYKLYPENKSLEYAFWQMCIDPNSKKRGYKVSGRIYEEVRINFCKDISQTIKEDKERGNKISQTNKNFSKEKREAINQKISSTFKNKTEEEKQQRSKNIGIGLNNRNIEEIQKWKDKKSLVRSQPVLQFDLQNNFIKEWPSITEADRTLHADVGACLKGYQLTAGGSKWKYKNQPTPKCKIIPKWNPQKVYQIDPTSNQVIKIWDCVNQIRKELGWQIDSYLKGKIKQNISHNFLWYYEEDYKKLNLIYKK